MNEKELMKALDPYGPVSVSITGSVYYVHNRWAQIGNPFSPRQGEEYTTLAGALKALHVKTIENVAKSAVLAAAFYERLSEDEKELKRFKRRNFYKPNSLSGARENALVNLLTLADP